MKAISSTLPSKMKSQNHPSDPAPENNQQALMQRGRRRMKSMDLEARSAMPSRAMQ
jgi:uncharacterized protein involved in copper resistance